MSQWTHVAATIRFDALRFPGLPHTRPSLGATCSFNSREDEWDACDVPCGSEGSLQHHIWENPERNDLAAYVATIWGDLRDYSDVAEVLAYLARMTDGQFVRQGVAMIDVEGRPAMVARYDGESKGWLTTPQTTPPTPGDQSREDPK